MTIQQFCQAFNISEGLFYKLKKQGLGPREMKVGTRTLISVESAIAWGRERERAVEAGSDPHPPGEDFETQAVERAVKAGTAAARSPTHVSKKRRRP